MKSSPRFIVGCLSACGFLIAAYTLAPEVILRTSCAAQEAPAGQARPELEAGGVADFSAPFKAAAMAVRPSVVSVRAVRTVKMEKDDSDSESPDMEDLLDRFFHSAPREGLRQVGVGTGIIVSAEGHVITNNHLVDQAEIVEVKLPSDEEVRATVIGTDPRTDLAVIKVEAGSLQPAKLGDSDQLQVGEWVMALGNSFGLSGTLTAGIVSATGRCNVGIMEYENFIQTDAAINPGNSGGPLVNLKGEVVGINTAIFSRSGGSLGIGFAVPSNMARTVMQGLMQEGRVVRGYLGVSIQDMSKSLAQSFGYSGNDGALVVDVTPDGPAGPAGILEGDIVVRLDGSPVKSSVQLRNAVACIRPGSKVEVEIFRGGDIVRYTVDVAELDSPAAATPAQAGASLTPRPSLGLTVKAMPPGAGPEGVVVTGVEQGSLSEKAGLKVGDVIINVEKNRISDVATFEQAIQPLGHDRGVRLKLRRGQGSVYVFIQP